MHRAKAGPDTCLCGCRLELGRHLVEELVALTLVDRRGHMSSRSISSVVRLSGIGVGILERGQAMLDQSRAQGPRRPDGLITIYSVLSRYNNLTRQKAIQRETPTASGEGGRGVAGRSFPAENRRGSHSIDFPVS